MFDTDAELDAVTRHVRRDPETVTVILRRDFPAAHDAVWEALTDPEQLRAWFSPVTGEFYEGGRYQIEGNASGEIWECRPREHFMLTFGSQESLLTVELAYAGDDTTVQLTHGVPISMAGSGAGAFYVGPGWDGALLGLAMYLRGDEIGDPVEMAGSAEIIEFNAASIERWQAVIEPSGTADADEIAAGRQAAVQQFTPPGR